MRVPLYICPRTLLRTAIAIHRPVSLPSSWSRPILLLEQYRKCYPSAPCQSSFTITRTIMSQPYSQTAQDEGRSDEQSYKQALSLLSSIESNKSILSKLEATPSSAPITPSAGPSPAPDPGIENDKGKQSKQGDPPPSASLPTTLHHLKSHLHLDPSAFPFKTIHIAGTKGKGSTAAYATSLLLHLRDAEPATYGGIGKVGTYTSPHLLSVRERVLIDGKMLEKGVFARYVFEVWDLLSRGCLRDFQGWKGKMGGEVREWEQPQTENKDKNNTTLPEIPPYMPRPPPNLDLSNPQALETWAHSPSPKPFYFLFLTLLSFHIFSAQKVRSAVIEVGIGGLHDPTNILPPHTVSAAVVTKLGLDHTALLGKTIEEIAEQKGGIFKRGMVAITGCHDSEDEEEMRGFQTLWRIALRRGVRCMERVRPRGGLLSSTVGTTMGEGGLGDGTGGGGVGGGGRSSTLNGTFQAQNRALAMAAVVAHLVSLGILDSTLVAQEDRSNDPLWLEGLAKARLRGRCEVLADPRGLRVKWFVDGAHTVDSIHETGMWFRGMALGTGGENGGAVEGKMEGTSEQPEQPEERPEHSSPSSTTTKKRIERIVIFNQSSPTRSPARLLETLLSCVAPPSPSSPPLIHFFILPRNDTFPTTPPSRDEPSLLTELSCVISECHSTHKWDISYSGHSVAEAVQLCRAMTRIGKDGEEVEVEVLVTGSLHLVASVLTVLEPESADEVDR